MSDSKLSASLASIYYSPKGYWKCIAAITNLSATAKDSENMARSWLKKQTIWQIYLPALRHIPRPKFDIATPNEVHQADLLFLSHDKVRRKTYMPSPWSTSPADSKRLSLWIQKRPKRWPTHCLALTGGDL